MTVESVREFIEAELFQLTLAAVTQRGRVYRQTLSEGQRRPVREVLRDLSREHANPVTEGRHLVNIDRVAQTLTEGHAPVLRNGEFRIGSAQKALNLHLKYRWCLGEIPMPPHCPFDAIVLRAIPGWRSRSWTAINSLQQYRDLVAAARTTMERVLPGSSGISRNLPASSVLSLGPRRYETRSPGAGPGPHFS